ncbi:unnamed protein product [Paramecium pentaurelia]|uniref:Uncharacterized protein n=1 Tax=Paramecium pentaurelia TaxID=43138 RepID=A0A8S1U2S0_9CILI|nr:unnamed protein product [Paramecium pentaurelia]
MSYQQLNINFKKSPFSFLNYKTSPRYYNEQYQKQSVQKVLERKQLQVSLRSQEPGTRLILYHTTFETQGLNPLSNIEELNIDSNCSTDSSQRQENLSPIYYCPKGKEPCGELQVVLNGEVIQVISQTRSRRKSRKFSDQENYAMSNFIAGPKCLDIPCPQFL